MGIRATQEVIEVVAQPITTAVSVSQEVLEVVIEPPSTANLRVTQEVIEVILNEGEAESPAAPSGGKGGMRPVGVVYGAGGRATAIFRRRRRK
jgi:hypothetical protein